MDLREIARPFLTFHIRSGKIAMFWLDDWKDLGLLLNLTGPGGPLVFGIGMAFTVQQAVTAGAWLPPRGKHPC